MHKTFSWEQVTDTLLFVNDPEELIRRQKKIMLGKIVGSLLPHIFTAAHKKPPAEGPGGNSSWRIYSLFCK